MSENLTITTLKSYHLRKINNSLTTYIEQLKIFKHITSVYWNMLC